MSISGILSSSLSHYQLGAVRTPYQKTFNQLSQDLQSGNLSAAQSDFATLQKAISQPATTSPTTSDPVTQAFHQLATDLQSGNLSAAQKDFSTLQQDLQASRFHHHYRLNVSSGDLTDSTSSILQAQPPISIGSLFDQTEPPLGRLRRLA